MTLDPRRRVSREELAAAYGATVPDLVRPGLDVLLCGINPSLWSAVIGCHFGTPGNRLWPVLHAAGWTSRQLHPTEVEAVLACGLGLTNLVQRATARADELSAAELRAGLGDLEARVKRWAPGWVAFLGMTAYRTATGDRRAQVGPQDRRIGGARVWLLPNTSGLNASWQLPALAAAYAELRQAVDSEGGRRARARQTPS